MESRRLLAGEQLLHAIANPSTTPQGYTEFGGQVATDGVRGIVGAPFASVSGYEEAGVAYLYDVQASGGEPVVLENPAPDYYELFGYAVDVDGPLAVVGAPENGVGSVYIYDSSTGSLLRTLDNPHVDQSYGFGEAVAVAGSTVVVGLPNESTVYLFDANSGTLLQTITDPDVSSGDLFGSVVAISGDKVLIADHRQSVGVESRVGNAHLFDATSGALLHTFDNPTPGQSEEFGEALAIDGNTIVIGAWGDSTAGDAAGAAYLYDATSGNLVQTLYSPSPAASEHFGNSVAAAAGKIYVGAPARYSASLAGSVYVYDAASGGYLSTLSEPSPTVGEQFGSAVAAAGGRTLVGAMYSEVAGVEAGQVFVYDASDQLQRTIDSPVLATEEYYGISVDISGEMAIAGSYGGFATVHDHATGQLLYQLTSPEPSVGRLFGEDVAISSNYFAVGDSGAEDWRGAVYIYDASTGQPVRTLRGPHADAEFGQALSFAGQYLAVTLWDPDYERLVQVYDVTTGALLQTIADPVDESTPSGFGDGLTMDGTTLLIGAPYRDVTAGDVGAAYLYDAVTGQLLHTLDNPTPEQSDRFGLSVAVRGNLAVVGSYLDDTQADGAGAAYVFDVTTGQLLWTLLEPAESAEWHDQLGRSVAISETSIYVGAASDNSGEAVYGGAVHVFDAATGAYQQRLTYPDPADYDYFGGAMAVDGYRLIVGADEIDGPTVQRGAIFLYARGPVVSDTTFASSGSLDVGSTSLAVQFSEAVVGAEQASAYTLQGAGADGLLGSGDDTVVPVAPAYDAATATLSFAPLSVDLYRLTVRDTLLSDATGQPLDGDRDSVLGGDFVSDFVVGGPTHTLTSPGGYDFDIQYGDWGAGQLVEGPASAFDGLGRILVSDTSFAPEAMVEPPVRVFETTLWELRGQRPTADWTSVGAGTPTLLSNTFTLSEASIVDLDAAVAAYNGTGAAFGQLDLRFMVDGAPLAPQRYGISPGSHATNRLRQVVELPAGTHTVTVEAKQRSGDLQIAALSTDADFAQQVLQVLAYPVATFAVHETTIWNLRGQRPTADWTSVGAGTPTLLSNTFTLTEASIVDLDAAVAAYNGTSAAFGQLDLRFLVDGVPLAPQRYGISPGSHATNRLRQVVELPAGTHTVTVEAKQRSGDLQIAALATDADFAQQVLQVLAYPVATFAVHETTIWDLRGQRPTADWTSVGAGTPTLLSNTFTLTEASIVDLDAAVAAYNGTSAAFGQLDLRFMVDGAPLAPQRYGISPGSHATNRLRQVVELPAGTHTVTVEAKQRSGDLQIAALSTDADFAQQVLQVLASPMRPAISPSDDGRTIMTPLQIIDGLQVHREVSVPSTGAYDFARTVDTYENQTGSVVASQIKITGNLGSDAATTVFATSDGDLLVEPTDWWFGTDDGDGTGALAVIHLLHGPAGLQPAAVDVVDDNVEWTYPITVPAGQTLRLAHFTVLGRTRAEAIAAAEALVTPGGFGGQAAAFLTADELASLANFQFPGVTIDTAGGLEVAENGSADQITDTFTVVLDTAPASDVVVTVQSSNPGEAAISPATLIFTPTNYHVPQTVSVTGVNDGAADADSVVTVTVAVDAAQSAEAYAAVANQTVEVLVRNVPLPPVVSGPSGAVSSTLPTFDFAPSPGASFYSLYLVDLSTTPASVAYMNFNIQPGAVPFTLPAGEELEDGHAYRYFIRAHNAYGYSTSAGANGAAFGDFTVGSTPAAPPPPTTATSHSSGSQPTVQWPASEQASSYEIYLVNLDTGATAASERGLTTPAWTPAAPLPDASYRIFVRAWNALGTGGFGAPYDFVVGTPLVPPVPTSAESASGNPVTIAWPASPGANSYEIYLVNLDSGQPVASAKGLVGTSHTHAAELPAARYRVFVRAWNNAGTSGWGSPYDFTLGTPLAAPAVPTGLTALGTDTARPTLQWDAVAGASGYAIWFVNVDSGGLVASVSGLTTNQYLPDFDLANGNYGYYVRAYNSAGSSPFAPRYDFAVAAPLVTGVGARDGDGRWDAEAVDLALAQPLDPVDP